MNNDYEVRYGQSFDEDVETSDLSAVSVSFYIGKPGHTPAKVISATFNEDGIAHLHADPEEMEIPLGTYKWQLNVYYQDGEVDKLPIDTDCDSCDDIDLPNFYVKEALDEQEVVVS